MATRSAPAERGDRMSARSATGAGGGTRSGLGRSGGHIRNVIVAGWGAVSTFVIGPLISGPSAQPPSDALDHGGHGDSGTQGG